MYIVILGAPGAGKGTQSQLISDEYLIPGISTGDLLRGAAANPHDITSRKIASTIRQGLLVSNDLILKVIKDRIQNDDCKNGFILDGFPRSLEQAKLMSQILPNDSKNIVINLSIDTEVLVKRLIGRFSCKLCGSIYNKFFHQTKIENVCDSCGSTFFIFRNDDEEDVIRKRMTVYEAETKPMIEYYELIQNEKFSMKTFDGSKNVHELFDEIKHFLNSFKR